MWPQSYKIYDNELSQKPFEEVWKPVENSLEELKNMTDGKMSVLALLVSVEKQEYSEYYITFRQTAFNYGWEVIDMSSAYKNYKNSDIRVSVDDSHSNVLGQRLIAEEIYKKLYEKKLLP